MRRWRICVLLTALLLMLANAAPGRAGGYNSLDYDDWDEDGYAEIFGLCLICCDKAESWYYRDAYLMPNGESADISAWLHHRPEEHERAEMTWDGGTLVIPEGVTRLNISTEFDTPGHLPIMDLPSDFRFPSTLETIDYCDLWDYNMRDECLFTGTHLTIPEGVKTFRGFLGFYRPYLRRISLPSTLENLEIECLAYAPNLEYVRVAEGNPHFKVVDNVLFTADGKTLLFYPRTKKDAHYDVPAGVETIGPYAFSDNHYIRSISLPFGLKEIEYEGIYACYALESVSVPVTLEKIGERCFQLCMNLKQMSLLETVEGWAYWEDWRSWPEQFYDDGYTRDDYRIDDRPALLSAGDDEDTVRILSAMDDQSEVLFEADNGGHVTVCVANMDAGTPGSNDYRETPASDSYYKVCVTRCSREDKIAPDSFYGFVKKDEVVFMDAYPKLFDVEKAVPKRKLTASSVYPCTYPCRAMAYRLPVGTLDTFAPEVCGQWVACSFYGIGGLTLYDKKREYLSYGIVDGYLVDGDLATTILDTKAAHHFWIGDVTLKRAWTEDPAVYGIVLTDDYRTRAPLYAQPYAHAERLGLYFSGTQLEVLAQEGAWTQVRMADGRQGYLKSDDVTIVEMEAFE